MRDRRLECLDRVVRRILGVDYAVRAVFVGGDGAVVCGPPASAVYQPVDRHLDGAHDARGPGQQPERFDAAQVFEHVTAGETSGGRTWNTTDMNDEQMFKNPDDAGIRCRASIKTT